MNAFSISRITSPKGIFRLSGRWRGPNADVLGKNKGQSSTDNTIELESIEVLGTDGWVRLKQSNPKVEQLITELAPFISEHLLGEAV